MLIVFVHGVNTRSPDLPDGIRRYIERYLAPPGKSERLDITYTYWGGLGGAFRFGGRSRPRTRYLGMGPADQAHFGQLGEFPQLVNELPIAGQPAKAAVSPTGYIKPGPAGGSAAGPAPISSLPHDEVTAFLLGLAYATDAVDDDAFRAALAIAIDDATSEPSLWYAMAKCQDAGAELDLLRARVLDRLDRAEGSGYVKQGSGKLAKFFDTASETLSRAGSYPGFTLSKAVAELRPRLDSFLEQFTGDVFVYLTSRQPAQAGPAGQRASRAGQVDQRLLAAMEATAGPIPQELILDLIEAHGRRAPGERLILITHSMGGQIAYDVLTWFLPAMAAKLEETGIAPDQVAALLPVVDFWCATASQVGLFEELGLFLASNKRAYGGEKTIPKPTRFLGGWWNVWDHNDLLSYSVAGIFDGVEDGPYNSGRSMAAAHSAYLQQPSFYKELAVRLKPYLNPPGAGK